MKYAEIPLGFGMALTQHPGGMKMFTSLGESEQQRIIKYAEKITSEEEMRQYVNGLMDRR